jgi:demethylmenaquinone methyltransferase/2-methoxy-6-polyprenyl-1,4-benzoquinol methylase
VARVGPAQLAEQVAYYRARAPEYDEAYERVNLYDHGEERNARFHRGIDMCLEALEQLDLRGDVLEVAAGTGFWTVQLAARARSVLAIDAAPEALAVNHERCATFSNVTYTVADAFAWQPDRTWDACVFCFWITHVPDHLLAPFLRTVAAATRPSGTVFVVDELPDDDTSEDGTELEIRELNDGRAFTIVKHRRDTDELVAAFAAAGLDVGIHRTVADQFYGIAQPR